MVGFGSKFDPDIQDRASDEDMSSTTQEDEVVEAKGKAGKKAPAAAKPVKKEKEKKEKTTEKKEKKDD